MRCVNSFVFVGAASCHWVPKGFMWTLADPPCVQALVGGGYGHLGLEEGGRLPYLVAVVVS